MSLWFPLRVGAAFSTLRQSGRGRDASVGWLICPATEAKRVAFSLRKHLASHAAGRGLTYHEIVFLQERGVELRASDYRMQDMIRFVVRSDLFLKK